MKQTATLTRHQSDSATMVLPKESQGMKGKHASYTIGKTGELPNWELSYERFQGGERLESIAMKQHSGKSILSSTVVGHLQQAPVQGRKLQILRVVVISVERLL